MSLLCTLKCTVSNLWRRLQVRQEQMREEIAHHKATVDFLVEYCLPIPNEVRILQSAG